LRLHTRLILLNAAGIGLITLLLGYFIANSIRNTIEVEIEEQLFRSATLASEFIAQDTGVRNPVEIANTLSKILSVRVTLIELNGVVSGDSDVPAVELSQVENHSTRPEVIQTLRTGRGTAIRRSSTVGASFIYVALRSGDRVLRLAMPLTAVDQLLSRLWRQLLFAMIVAVAMAFAFGYVVYSFVSRPLRRMAEASQKLAVGDLDHHIPVVGDIDLARVGSALNAMAKALKLRMDELVEGRRQIEATIDAMSAGVVVFDRDARVSFANRASRELLEIHGEPEGKAPLEILRHAAMESIVRSALQGQDVPAADFTTSGGRTLNARATPMRQKSGEIAQVVVVFHDLTQLRRIEKVRKDFVANVSHELKTPLTSIRGYAETLLNDPPEDRALSQKFLAAIERNSRVLQALVDDMLVLSKLESEPPVEKSDTDLRELIEDQVQSRSRLIDDRKIQVEIDCPNLRIAADRERLARALANLLDNAIHYNRPGGRIRIAARRLPNEVTIEVEDTGSGIPRNSLHRIFERFYRVEESHSRESGGTGLGLAIAKHAVESQGGAISAASQIGQGSTFTIKLPTG
jgi:two-component system phosphate regulon sensor histidine kinase PhoR